MGQTVEIDSLKRELITEIQDTSKVILGNRLSFLYHRISPDTAFMYASEAMELAEGIGYTIGVGNSFNVLGIIAYSQADYAEALENYQKFLEIMKSAGDQRGIHRALNNIGLVFKSTGKYHEALEQFNESLRVQKSINDSSVTGGTLNNIGLMHQELGNYSEAVRFYYSSIDAKKAFGGRLSTTYLNFGRLREDLGHLDEARECYYKSLAFNDSTNNWRGLALDYRNLGSLSMKENQRNQALAYYDKALVINRKINNRIAISDLLNDIGKIYLNDGDTAEAKKYLEEAHAIKTSIGHRRGVVQTETSLSWLHLVQENYKEAGLLAEKSYHSALTIGLKKEIVSLTDILYQVNLKLQLYESAISYLEINKVYNDSLLNELKIKEITGIDVKYQYEQISRENTLLQKENELRQVELEKTQAQNDKQRIVILFSLLVGIVMLAGIYFIFRLYKEKKLDHKALQEVTIKIREQKKKIETQAEELGLANKDISAFNLSLENIIKERTEKIEEQNQKLKAYAFANSHEVRAPLARLMGLADQLKKEETTHEQRMTLNVMIEISARELDEVIRKNHSLLYLDMMKN